MNKLYVKLNTGAQMPAIGYGCNIFPENENEPIKVFKSRWSDYIVSDTERGSVSQGKTDVAQQPDDQRYVEIIENALESGYRHFDTARLYGSEKCLGNAIQNKIKQGLISRQDVFITTKLWCNRFQRDEVVPTLKESLKNLGFDYVDLFLIHFPTAFKSTDDLWPSDVEYRDTDCLETWQGMETCYELGLAKAIGVSNFNSKQITRILENCNVKPANNQIESHPFLANQNLVDFCHKHDITVTAFAPLCGIRSYCTNPDPPRIFTDPTIKQVAEGNNRSPAQVTLWYHIQRNIAVIPTSRNLQRMKENFEVSDFKLSDDDMILMALCNRNFRLCAVFGDHLNCPFNEEF